MLTLEPHPLLQLGAFTATFPDPLGRAESPQWLRDLLVDGAATPLERGEEIRSSVRALLRHGGYKPTGRGKPASEYLLRTAQQGALRSINVAVDACNVVSLHSGLPISVLDLDLLERPLSVALGDPNSSYTFNPSGQKISLDGLLCLYDAHGPCANAVKDSQRTKAHDATSRVLALVWGSNELQEHTQRATAWYRELLERARAVCADLPLVRREEEG